MRKKTVFLSSLLMLMGISMANAQKAYTYVQQDDAKLGELGTAAFDLSSSPTVEFVDGKAVMTIGDNTVAKLPMSDKGQLVVEFTTTMEEADLNKVTKDYTNDFATLYSPFQLTVPSGTVEVYAPTYDATKHELVCSTETKVEAGVILPVETAVLLKNAGTAEFTISTGASTATTTDLSGSSLQIKVPTVESGNTLYTLGHETNDPSKYGFFSYTGTELNPGLAWLVAPTVNGSDAKYVEFNFGDEETAIGIIPAAVQGEGVRKYVENGKVVIVKDGQKYNAGGACAK